MDASGNWQECGREWTPRTAGGSGLNTSLGCVQTLFRVVAADRHWWQSSLPIDSGRMHMFGSSYSVISCCLPMYAVVAIDQHAQ